MQIEEKLQRVGGRKNGYRKLNNGEARSDME